MSTPDNTTIPDGYKRCSNGERCINPIGPILPANIEYFPPCRAGRMGLKARCRFCVNAYARKYRNTPKNKTYAKEYETKRYHNPERKAYTLKHNRVRQQTDEYKTYMRVYVRSKKYRDCERIRNQKPLRKAQHRKRSAIYRHTPEGRLIRFQEKQRRRARERNLPNSFSASDWKFALSYWNDCCAICGRARDFERTLAADHWIPLSDPRSNNPGSVAENIIPLCHGIDGCNNSKNNRDPLEWLVWKLGEKAREKLAEIEAYIEIVRARNDK